MNDFTLLRVQNGFTRDQLADYLGLNVRTIRRYESNRAPKYVIRAVRALSGFIEHPNFEGWRFHQGLLYTPENEGFKSGLIRAIPYITQELQALKNSYKAHQIFMQNLDFAD